MSLVAKPYYSILLIILSLLVVLFSLIVNYNTAYAGIYPGLNDNTGYFYGGTGYVPNQGIMPGYRNDSDPTDTLMCWIMHVSHPDNDKEHTDKQALPYSQIIAPGGNYKMNLYNYLISQYNLDRCDGWSKMGAAFIMHTMLGHPPGSPPTITAADRSEFLDKIVNNSDITLTYAGLENPINNSSMTLNYSNAPNYPPVREDPEDAYFYKLPVGATGVPDALNADLMYEIKGATSGYYYGLKLRCANPAGEINIPPEIVGSDSSTYSVSTNSVDYEKGTGGSATLRFELAINSSSEPCDYSESSGSLIETVIWKIHGPLSPDIYINTGVGNCTGEFISTTVGGLVNSNTTARYDLTINGLDARAPDKYQYTVSIVDLVGLTAFSDIDDGTGTLTANSQLTVYEVPYVKFYGNDVMVCGNGSDNRFVWGIADSQGSNSEYSTVFLDENRPPEPDFIGLNSYSGGNRDNLETNWGSGMSCDVVVDNIPSPPDSYFVDYSDSEGYYYESGDIDIDSDIVVSNTLTTSPEGYKVVIIHAGGDIYINKGVTSINAILIADGNIYTCANGPSSLVDPDQFDEQCDNQLTINGALIAQEVHLMRAHGSRLLSAGPAEQITYPWQLHFAKSTLTESQINDIDSLVELPPRL